MSDPQGAGSGAAGSGASGSGTGTRSGSGSGSVVGSGADLAAGWVTVPAGWRSLPDLVVPVAAQAAAAKVRVEGREGYGDPASGCFALLQRVSAPAVGFSEGQANAALLRALGTSGFTAGPVSQAELPFVGRGVQGRIRSTTRQAGDRIAVLSLACFYNDREPERCRPVCDAMLDSAGARR